MSNFKFIIKYFFITAAVSGGALVAVLVIMRLMREVIESFKAIL
jgi:hypothetical protein